MNKYDRIISIGPFSGKKIELAPTEGVKMFQPMAEDFMEAIFCMAPGSYLITDESSLQDFKGVEDMELPDMYRKILRLRRGCVRHHIRQPGRDLCANSQAHFRSTKVDAAPNQGATPTQIH